MARPSLLPEIRGLIRDGWVSCSEVVLANAGGVQRGFGCFGNIAGSRFPSVKGFCNESRRAEEEIDTGDCW